jgi:polyketide synthase PksN
MIDFIDYVVGELRSKRLSKADAAGLVKQFSLHSAAHPQICDIHPLLHRNTSDLIEQRYSSTFTGEEPFLADHQVQVEGDAPKRVLPGVAYLEMALAAVTHALPTVPENDALELRNVVWARPIVVTEAKQVNIALLTDDSGEIDFEIYSQEGWEEVIHAQGRVISGRQAADGMSLDIGRLKEQMQRDELHATALYAAFAGMGLIYGSTHQSIAVIHQGERQVLAHLHLPDEADATLTDYKLHPSMMDGALQAAAGLADELVEAPGRPSLPFAVDRVRIFAPCVRDM